MMRTKRIGTINVTVINRQFNSFIDVTVHHREYNGAGYISTESYHCFSDSLERRARFLARAQRMQMAFNSRSDDNTRN